MNLKAFVLGDESLTDKQKKQRMIFLYIFFGGMTTLISQLVFRFSRVLDNPNASDLTQIFIMGFRRVIAWVVAVLFAFYTNRRFVFSSHGPVMKELYGFLSARIGTLLVFELGLFYLCLFILEKEFYIPRDQIVFQIYRFDMLWEEVLSWSVAVFVLIGNYVLSKWFVFKKPKTETGNIEKT